MHFKPYWSYISPFVQMCLLHHVRAKKSLHLHIFRPIHVHFLIGFGNASSRPVVLLSFHVARGSVWLGRGFCCVDATRLCFSATLGSNFLYYAISTQHTQAFQLLAVIMIRQKTCFTIALTFRVKNSELLHRCGFKKRETRSR